MLGGERKALIANFSNEGYLTQAEALNLINLVDELKTDYPIVEIGVFAGNTTRLLAQYLQMTGRKNKVIGIDTCSYVPAGALLSGFAEFPNIEFIEGSSYDPKIIDSIKDISLLFIDGDHIEEAVDKDIDNWLPKVREICAFHDYRSDAKDHQVKESVEKKKLEVEQGADSLGILRVKHDKV